MGTPASVQTFPALSGLGVTWTAPADASETVENYLVQQQRSNNTWADASKLLPPGTRSWVDANLQTGSSATYRVVALNADGQSEPSPAVTGTRPDSDPAVGGTDVLVVDADAGGSATWLKDEPVGPVVQVTGESTRTLSAGTVRVTLPLVLPGPGAYPVGPGKQPFVLRQGDRDCVLDGTVTVAELAYTADLQVATMAAHFTGACEGAASVIGDLRVKSTQTYAALAIEPARVDLGRMGVGTEITGSATVKNVGTSTVDVVPQPLGASDAWSYRGDQCTRLAPGESCSVGVSFTPETAANHTKVVGLATPSATRQLHHVRFTASAYGLPSPPTDVTAAATYDGVDLTWRPSSWGNSTPTAFAVHRSVPGQADATFRLPPEQLKWTEPHPDPQYAATYRLTAVTDQGESGPSGPVTPNRHPTEQMAVFAGPTGRPLSLGSLALPVGRQVVSAVKAPTTERAALTTAPNGVDLAYVVATGDKSELWLRRAGADQLLWSAPGIARPSWSPDGSRIAFVVTEGSTMCVDVVAVADRSDVRAGCGLDFPTWHPDGRTLIVQDLRVPGEPLTRVEIGRGRIATLPGSNGATHATVDPTGSWLGFVPAARPDHVGFLPLAGGTPKFETTVGHGPVETLAWNTYGDRLALLTKVADRDQVMWIDARAVLADEDFVLSGTSYVGDADRIADLTWQGQRAVIKPTPAVAGPSVSIGFDTSALEENFVAECWLDGVLKGECTSPFTATGLTTGTHKFQVKTYWRGRIGSSTSLATRSLTVDATGPVARVVAPTYESVTAGTATVTYSATDSVGTASYDVRYRKASYLSGFGAYIQPWTGTTATSVNLTLDPGHEYCVSVRAKDKLGNLGAWSADKCFSRPLDADRRVEPDELVGVLPRHRDADHNVRGLADADRAREAVLPGGDQVPDLWAGRGVCRGQVHRRGESRVGDDAAAGDGGLAGAECGVQRDPDLHGALGDREVRADRRAGGTAYLMAERGRRSACPAHVRSDGRSPHEPTPRGGRPRTARPVWRRPGSRRRSCRTGGRRGRRRGPWRPGRRPRRTTGCGSGTSA
jgi:hypothetical protein